MERNKQNKRSGETRYPGLPVSSRGVAMTDDQANHCDRQAALLNMKNPGCGWSRSKYIQFLIDTDMKKKEKEEEHGKRHLSPTS